MDVNLPDVVKDATDEYKQENDIYSSFLNEVCETGLDHNVAIPAAEFYERFRAWYPGPDKAPYVGKFSAGVLATKKVTKSTNRYGTFYCGVKFNVESYPPHIQNHQDDR